MSVSFVTHAWHSSDYAAMKYPSYIGLSHVDKQVRGLLLEAGLL
jgi:hypothetical protein